MAKPIHAADYTFRNIIEKGFLYKDKAYAEKYQLHGKTIMLVGANFDYEQRKVTEWVDELDRGN